MVFTTHTMKKLIQDNEELSFITLGAATLNVVRYLESSEDKQEHRERDAQRSGDDEQKKEEHRAYVEQRLREIAAFEERFRSGKTSRRKRN
jgi:selenocysteine-specific translation elongation factor